EGPELVGNGRSGDRSCSTPWFEPTGAPGSEAERSLDEGLQQGLVIVSRVAEGRTSVVRVWIPAPTLGVVRPKKSVLN
ncbi:MAG: hypothetical protein NTX58_08380, partial [Actinobacteria bacterium]|nr:hypothetical protein [Actinomycetota bacterium]